MSDRDLDRLAVIHGLLASPTRLVFIAELASGPKSGTHLGEKARVTASAVSMHLTKMRNAGLVTATRNADVRQVLDIALAEPVHPLVASTIALLNGGGE